MGKKLRSSAEAPAALPVRDAGRSVAGPLGEQPAASLGTRPHIAGPADFAAAFAVPRETVEKLELYAELLRQWQRAVNLVAPSTLDDVWHRHFTDCAQLINHAPNAEIWVDLGSGAGFPGVVIAIILANHENHVVHLIESNSRKCAFLSEVARKTGAPVKVHEGRIEDIARGGRIGPADVVTSRALAPLKLLLQLAGGFWAEGTLGLFLKGQGVRQEIDEALSRWRFEFDCASSRTSGEGMILEVRKLALKPISSGSAS
jgi:16S rRNA (guanine527-N7)-methyltransferase